MNNELLEKESNEVRNSLSTDRLGYVFSEISVSELTYQGLSSDDLDKIFDN